MAATPAPLLRDVGRRIAELRVARGWTQDAFAERMDVSVGYIREVEAGHENLTLTSLVKLATLLGVTVPDLFVPPASRQVRRGRPPKGLAKGLTSSTSDTSEPTVAGNERTGSGSTPAGALSTAGSAPQESETVLAGEDELERMIALALSLATEQANRGVEWASGLRDVLHAVKKAVHGVMRTGTHPSKGASATKSTKASLDSKAASELLGKMGVLSRNFLGTAKDKSTKNDPKRKPQKRP